MANGKYWVREPKRANGSRPSLGTFKTKEEANAFADQWDYVAVTKDLTPHPVIQKDSFVLFGQRVLDEREKDDVRGIKQERNRVKTHLATAFFANERVESITSQMIARWLRELGRKQVQGRSAKKRPRKISIATIKRCLALASAIFDEAIQHDPPLILVNPCAGLKIKRKRAGQEATKEKWGYLFLEEQRQIATCEDVPYEDRLAIRFAVGTGLRQGEQFNLHLEDVIVDGPEPEVVVRYGSKGMPPNVSGRPEAGNFEQAGLVRVKLDRRMVGPPLDAGGGARSTRPQLGRGYRNLCAPGRDGREVGRC
ncbi:hypothetical protein [Pendulispora albinea]|uniref:Core-binding (CB) domain-containing protein n=1 Tax=Pendulispora albinea TaxID=2741071 RepID=A0ABZ2M9L2_9BACT